MWGWMSLERFRLDVRYGLRTLWRAKWISLAAVATLALGIGANTALFSVVDTILLRSLPFPDPDRLMMVAQRDPHTGDSTDYFAPTYSSCGRVSSGSTRVHYRARNGASLGMTECLVEQSTLPRTV